MLEAAVLYACCPERGEVQQQRSIDDPTQLCNVKCTKLQSQVGVFRYEIAKQTRDFERDMEYLRALWRKMRAGGSCPSGV